MGLDGTDAGDFKISDAACSSFKDSPNYEGPRKSDMDEDNIYKVTVTASEQYEEHAGR